MALRVGTGLLIVKSAAFDVPPPGVGLNMATLAVPAVTRSVAGILAVRRVLFTKVVVRFPPFQRTMEPFTKLVPVTINVRAGSPETADTRPQRANRRYRIVNRE